METIHISKFNDNLKNSKLEMSKIKIILNGEEKIINQSITLSDLIAELELDLKKIAIEKDLEIIHPCDFSKTTLQDGAKIEIVHFIGGG